jgi:hypothetical protein
VNVIAVDWSGRLKGSRGHLAVACRLDGRPLHLDPPGTRQEIVAGLVTEAERSTDLVVGLDFAFSFPEWFVTRLGAPDARELWGVVATEGERWLTDCAWPVWGRPGVRRPALPSHLRATEVACGPVAGVAPKSVFQIGGAGAVGTGSLRGMPFLAELHDAGFSIWPFDPPGWPRVVEVYPRLCTGPVVKSDEGRRRVHLAALDLPADIRRAAIASEDAFDAVCTVLVMDRAAADLAGLAPVDDPVTRLEGMIWMPPDAAVTGPEVTRSRSTP